MAFMSASERRKGLRGEHEVRRLLEAHGFDVRGLESGGDWLAFGHGLILQPETKWQETARVWLWQDQASMDAVAGALPLVAFRKSRREWWAMAPLEPLYDGCPTLFGVLAR